MLKLYKFQQFSRAFGDFHNIFASKPVFPEEKVEPNVPYDSYRKIDKLRKQRLWLFMEKERLNEKIKKNILRIREKDELMKPTDFVKDQKYFDERGLLGNEDISEFFEIDRETYLPYDLGFDDTIKDIKEKNIAEASQDQARDIWMKLGYTSTMHVINSVGNIAMKESLEKINRRIYSSRHKIEPVAYANIENEEDPRSQINPNKDPEYFSDDFSEQEPSDELGEAMQMVREKYKHKLGWSDYEFNDAEGKDWMEKFGSSGDDSDNEKWDRHDPKIPKLSIRSTFFLRSDISILDKLKSKFKKKAFQSAVNQIKMKHKKKHLPQFYLYTPDGYLKYYDYHFNLKKYNGLAPSFRDIIVEAEKFISKEPKLRLLLKRDNYEKNKHFEPRYLDRNLTPENFVWSFSPQPQDAIYPGYLTGRLPFEDSDRTLIEMSDLVNEEVSKGFVPDSKDTSLKVYSIIKNDPYHVHFLNNHIKYWNESVREPHQPNSSPYKIKCNVSIPWEYIVVPRPGAIKLPPSGLQKLNEEGYACGKGKRKRARARAFVKEGTGIITINGENIITYCPDFLSRNRIIQPFRATRLAGTMDVVIRVAGGGTQGQSQAIQLAISKAITNFYPDSHRVLHQHEMLTRDPRRVERKKTSHYKARKSYTFVKR